MRESMERYSVERKGDESGAWLGSWAMGVFSVFVFWSLSCCSGLRFLDTLQFVVIAQHGGVRCHHGSL